MTSEQSGWNSQFETNLLIPTDSYRNTPAIQSSGYPPRNRRHQIINKQKHGLRAPLGNYTRGKEISYQRRSIVFCCYNVIGRNARLSTVQSPLARNYSSSCYLLTSKSRMRLEEVKVIASNWETRGLGNSNTCKLIFESTTTGDFPPSSSKTGVRCFAAAVITILPTLPLPNNPGTTYDRKYVHNQNETIHLILLLFSVQIMHLLDPEEGFQS